VVKRWRRSKLKSAMQQHPGSYHGMPPAAAPPAAAAAPQGEAQAMAMVLQEAQAQIGQLRAELYNVGRVADERR